MKRWLCERRSRLLEGAWCNVRVVEAETWAAARAAYVALEVDIAPDSADLRCSEVTPLNRPY